MLEQVPKDFQHDASYKLKEIFNQTSILNVRNTCEIRYNNETESDIKYIQSTMNFYGLSWDEAKLAADAGW